MKTKLLILNLLVLISLSLVAQPGALDPSFSSDGKVITAFGSFGDDIANAMIIQGDGKILVAGVANGKFAVVRYNLSGSLDNTFGTGGKVTTAVGTSLNDWGYGIALQTNGKIVVAGSTDNGADLDFAAVRYNSNGSLDNTFGTGGKVKTAIGTDDDVATSVAIQSDGKIVVAGYSYDVSFNYKFTVVRYNVNGTLDNTFDTDGKLTTSMGTSASSKDVAHNVLLQPDGKIVVSGHSINTSNSDFSIARYNTNGSLDNTFDFDGKLVTSFVSGNDGAYTAVLQSDNKILLGGYSYNGNYDFALARLNSDGSLDNTFGSGGKVISNLSAYDDIYGLAVQPNGKIIAAGQTKASHTYNNFCALRYSSSGTLDNSFDTDGLVSTDFGTVDDIGNAVAIQYDGKILVAGYSYDMSTGKDFAIARYLSDTVAVNTACVFTIYDTIPLQVYDTNFVTVTDTNFVTAYDTVAVCTAYDTTHISVYDTVTTYISVTDTLFINTTLTGISPPNNKNILKIYPNPTSDHIYIDNGNFGVMSGYQLIIENALAQQVFSSAINQSQFYIDISGWTGPGIYFVRIIDGLGNTIETKKIVLQ